MPTARQPSEPMLSLPLLSSHLPTLAVSSAGPGRRGMLGLGPLPMSIQPDDEPPGARQERRLPLDRRREQQQASLSGPLSAPRRPSTLSLEDLDLLALEYIPDAAAHSGTPRTGTLGGGAGSNNSSAWASLPMRPGSGGGGRDQDLRRTAILNRSLMSPGASGAATTAACALPQPLFAAAGSPAAGSLAGSAAGPGARPAVSRSVPSSPTPSPLSPLWQRLSPPGLLASPVAASADPALSRGPGGGGGSPCGDTSLGPHGASPLSPQRDQHGAPHGYLPRPALAAAARAAARRPWSPVVNNSPVAVASSGAELPPLAELAGGAAGAALYTPRSLPAPLRVMTPELVATMVPHRMQEAAEMALSEGWVSTSSFSSSSWAHDIGGGGGGGPHGRSGDGAGLRASGGGGSGCSTSGSTPRFCCHLTAAQQRQGAGTEVEGGGRPWHCGPEVGVPPEPQSPGYLAAPAPPAAPCAAAPATTPRGDCGERDSERSTDQAQRDRAGGAAGKAPALLGAARPAAAPAGPRAAPKSPLDLLLDDAFVAALLSALPGVDAASAAVVRALSALRRAADGRSGPP